MCLPKYFLSGKPIFLSNEPLPPNYWSETLEEIKSSFFELKTLKGPVIQVNLELGQLSDDPFCLKFPDGDEVALSSSNQVDNFIRASKAVREAKRGKEIKIKLEAANARGIEIQVCIPRIDQKIFIHYAHQFAIRDFESKYGEILIVPKVGSSWPSIEIASGGMIGHHLRIRFGGGNEIEIRLSYLEAQNLRRAFLRAIQECPDLSSQGLDEKYETYLVKN